MATHPRISRDPDILFGKPAIKGTRLSVEFILDLWPPTPPKRKSSKTILD